MDYLWKKKNVKVRRGIDGEQILKSWKKIESQQATSTSYQQKMNAFSSRIFRERLEEARKVRWSFWEHQRKGETGFSYNVPAVLNEDLLQKLNTESRGNCVLDRGDNRITEPGN